MNANRATVPKIMPIRACAGRSEGAVGDERSVGVAEVASVSIAFPEGWVGVALLLSFAPRPEGIGRDVVVVIADVNVAVNVDAVGLDVSVTEDQLAVCISEVASSGPSVVSLYSSALEDSGAVVVSGGFGCTVMVLVVIDEGKDVETGAPTTVVSSSDTVVAASSIVGKSRVGVDMLSLIVRDRLQSAG